MGIKTRRDRSLGLLRLRTLLSGLGRNGRRCWEVVSRFGRAGVSDVRCGTAAGVDALSERAFRMSGRDSRITVNLKYMEQYSMYVAWFV